MRIYLSILLSLFFFATGVFAQNGTWETDLAPMPVHKWAHSACVVNGKIYVIGGYVPVDLVVFNSVGSSGVEVYDPESNTWDTSKTEMPTARAYAAIAAMDGKIFVCGGGTAVFGATLNKLEIYNTATDTWDVTPAPMPTARYECRGIVFNGEFIVVGGFGAGSGKEVEAYNPETNQWRKLPDLRVKVSSMSLDTLNNKIYVAGGIPTSNNPIRQIQSYDPISNAWQIESMELPYEISHLGSTSAPGKIFLCGGNGFRSTPERWDLFHDVFMMDPVGQSIQKITELPTPRAGLTTHLINGALYVLGGYNPRTDISDWSEFFRPVLEVYHLPAYSYNTSIGVRYYRPEVDSISVQTQIYNLLNQPITVQAQIIGMDVGFLDTLDLFDDGRHGDRASGDGVYGNSTFVYYPEGYYQVDISTVNSTSGTTFTASNSAHFTTVGAVAFNGFSFASADTIPNPGDIFPFYAILKNLGQSGPALKITAVITSLNSLATISDKVLSFNDILAGSSSVSDTRKAVNISGECADGTILSFCIDIFSNNTLFWRDTFQIKVGYGWVSGVEKFPDFQASDLTVIPNPFSERIEMNYQLSVMSEIQIEIYNTTGQKVFTLTPEILPAGQYQFQWDAGKCPGGVYFILLRAGNQNRTVKVLKTHN